MFGPYEWAYNPDGLTDATLQQIRKLQQQKKPVVIYQWPKGELVTPKQILNDRFERTVPPNET